MVKPKKGFRNHTFKLRLILPQRGNNWDEIDSLLVWHLAERKNLSA